MMTWIPGLIVATMVPIANFFLASGHVLGAANDVAIFIILMFLVPMTLIWGFIEKSIQLWVRSWPIVLGAFGVEMLAWMLQRGHYGLWRIGNVLGKCDSVDAKVELCNTSYRLLTDFAFIPGSLQWIAAVSMICIASPVLSYYMPRYWFVVSVSSASAVWLGMLILFMRIA